jgi:hypothetical protein
MTTAHKHRLGGQTLSHNHEGGDVPHGYYGHPEDAGLRAFAGQAKIPEGDYQQEVFYTRQQVITALRTGIDLVACASGASGTLNPLHDSTLDRLGNYPKYASQVITDALNETANELDPMQAAGTYENSGTIWAQDVLNLTVNAVGHVLDHPAADLREVIEASYKYNDYETVIGWIA